MPFGSYSVFSPNGIGRRFAVRRGRWFPVIRRPTSVDRGRRGPRCVSPTRRGFTLSFASAFFRKSAIVKTISTA